MDTRSTEDSAQGAAFRPDVAAPEAAERAERAAPSSTPTSGSWARRCATGSRSGRVAITGLFVLAVLYTLFFARAFLLPIVLAVLLDFLLSPIIRALKRVRIPEPLGAALVLLALLGVGRRRRVQPGRAGARVDGQGARRASPRCRAGCESCAGRWSR